MDYTTIYRALNAKGLNWSTAASAMQCSPSSVMNIAARRSQSRKIGRGIATLISCDVADVFPDVPYYSLPCRSTIRQRSVDLARRSLEKVDPHNFEEHDSNPVKFNKHGKL